MKLTTKFWKMGMTAVLFGGGLFLISQGNAVYAENGVSIEESFSDPAFRAYVSDNLDTVKDGVLSAEEADAVTFIDVNCQGVKDLTGIEYFQNLTHLECVGSDKGRLTTLDISKNSKLEILYCVDNDLTEVNISENPSLRELALDTNPMKTLDIRNNPGLKLAVSKGAFISADEVGGHALYDGDEYEYSVQDEETEEWTIHYLDVDPSVLIIDRTGWEEFKDNWYFISEEGNTCVGWKRIGKNWFYFNNSGVMQTGWLKVGKKWYFFNNSGIMQTGWKKSGGKWYYLDPTSGQMVTGWKQISGKWYYFKTSGIMAANEYCKGYWLNSDGTWTYKPKASWKHNAKGWWYGDTAGWYAKNQTLTIDDKSYTFDKAGYLLE